jgi:hypothetical protein
LKRPKHHLGPGVSVEGDWFGDLNVAQLQAFDAYAEELEFSYCMFTVSLNEAIGLHASGSLPKSFQMMADTSALCSRLTALLVNILRSLAQHAKEHGTNPSIAPLNPADFYSDREQRWALKSLIRHRALLTRVSQSQSKVRTLRTMVDHVGSDFCVAADALASQGTAVDSPELWAAMDAWHFDLNTCLRESTVLLKCFLRVLPDDELRGFQETVSHDKTSRLATPDAKTKAAAVGGGATQGQAKPLTRYSPIVRSLLRIVSCALFVAISSAAMM